MILIKWILCTIVGGIIGFILMLINDSIFMLVSSGIVGLLVAAIVSAAAGDNSGMGKLISAVAFIVTFVLYLCLLGYLDVNAESMFFPMIFFFAPYVIITYAYFSSKASADDDKSDTNAPDQ